MILAKGGLGVGGSGGEGGGGGNGCRGGYDGGLGGGSGGGLGAEGCRISVSEVIKNDASCMHFGYIGSRSVILEFILTYANMWVG